MLTPIKKQQGTTTRERYLAALAEGAFFGLWAYPNVFTDEGITKSGIGKELCDLLVVFDKHIIVFSDKDVLFNQKIDVHVAWRRWFKKAVIKSCRQLYGAHSWLQDHPGRIYLDKLCQSKFPLPTTGDGLQIHLVAVTCNTVHASERFWGGGSSGTFYHLFPYTAEDCYSRPFTVGHLFPHNKYVHILDESSLDLLIEELSTISDFVGYLSEKERSIGAGEILQAAGEEELLAHYFRGRSSFGGLGQMLHPTGNLSKDGPISLVEGLWLEYQQETEYQVLRSLNHESAFWDQLISRFSHHIIEGNVAWGQEYEFEYHEMAVRHLAAESRASRSLLSRAFVEKFQEVEPDRRSARLVLSPTDGDRLYVFLFIPRDPGQDYEDYRQERLQYVQAYSLVAMHLNRKAKHVVVIATEPQLADGRSEDIYCVEAPDELSNEEKEEAKRLMAEDNILSDVRRERLNPLSQGSRPVTRKKAKVGRNERCPCGSGRKYKRCCITR